MNKRTSRAALGTSVLALCAAATFGAGAAQAGTATSGDGHSHRHDDRSQHRNRDEAWQMLRSRLYEHEMRIRMAAQQKLEDSKTDVGWGHQIRSYVLDQSRIKDLRTNLEISNTQKVLDGDLEPDS